MSAADSQNNSYSEENILANSIRIARQRISKLEDSNISIINHADKHNETFSFVKNKTGDSAAQAIKALQTKISELEAFNRTMTKQSSKIKKEMNLRTLELETIRNENEELTEKIRNLEEHNQKLTFEVKNKDKSIDEYRQKDKSTAGVLQQQNKIVAGFQSQRCELNRKIDSLQSLIFQMIKQLQQQKQKSKALINNASNCSSPYMINNSRMYEISKNSKSNKSKQNDNFPIIVDQPQTEPYSYSIQSCKKLRVSVRQEQTRMSRRPAKNSTVAKTERNMDLMCKQLKEKNQQLYSMLRASDKKCQEEERMRLIYRNQLVSLKETLNEIILEIGKLSESDAYKFKRLIVKVKKLDNSSLEFLKSKSIRHGRNNQSKSSKNSRQSSDNSVSRQKRLKMQDLNLSDHLSQSKSRQKQKRRSTSTLNISNSGTKNNMRTSVIEKETTNVSRGLVKKINETKKEIYNIHNRMKNQRDQNRINILKQELEKLVRLNNQLNSQMEILKKGYSQSIYEQK